MPQIEISQAANSAQPSPLFRRNVERELPMPPQAQGWRRYDEGSLDRVLMQIEEAVSERGGEMLDTLSRALCTCPSIVLAAAYLGQSRGECRVSRSGFVQMLRCGRPHLPPPGDDDQEPELEKRQPAPASGGGHVGILRVCAVLADGPMHEDEVQSLIREDVRWTARPAITNGERLGFIARDGSVLHIACTSPKVRADALSTSEYKRQILRDIAAAREPFAVPASQANMDRLVRLGYINKITPQLSPGQRRQRFTNRFTLTDLGRVLLAECESIEGGAR